MNDEIKENSQEDDKIDMFIENVRKLLTDAALSLENEEHKTKMLNILKNV